MSLIELDTIFRQKRPKLILKRVLAMVRFLRVDVSDQRIQIRGADGEGPVSALPGKRGNMTLHPFGRRGLQVFDQVSEGEGSRQPHRQVNMVGDAADALAFASGIARDGGNIREEIGAEVVADKWASLFGAEDDVHQHERERKGHAVDYRSGRWPSIWLRDYSWGVAPCWYGVAPLALVFLALIVQIMGCKSVPAPVSDVTGNSGNAPKYTYPSRPTIAPPPFKVFHHDASTFTLVTKDNASDSEIEAIVWQLRDAAHAHTLDKLNISESAIAEHKPTAWFHIYRGAKCAAEKYAPGAPPCGGSYHAAGDYTFGSTANPNWDDGILHTPDGKELPLWDSEAPYKS